MSKIWTIKLRREKSQNKSPLMNQSSESTCQSSLVMNQNWTYTQSEFLKICEQTTPKQMMLDLNHLLEGSALLLVKSMTGIEDIWKLMKIQNCYWRKIHHRLGIQSTMENNGPKTKDGCFKKVINIMRDLYQLAEQHNIKSRLYSGDRLETIYQIMGDWVTRWL